MACPDRNKDQRIIAEVERRKSVQFVQNDFYVIEAEGDLNTIASLGINEDQIIKLQRTETGYQVYIKNEIV